MPSHERKYRILVCSGYQKLHVPGSGFLTVPV